MTFRRILELALVTAVYSGCALSANEAQCKKWRDEGSVAGSFHSCIQCIETLGPGDPKPVRDCALGLDVSKRL